MSTTTIPHDFPLPAPEPSQRSDVWPWHTRRDDDGSLRIGSLNLRKIAQQWGTPVYVVSLDDLLGRAQVWKAAMDEAFWSGYGLAGAQVYYAGKAFLCKRVVRELCQEGIGIDTASEGELALALAAGAPPKLIGLHGNNKSQGALSTALEQGIGRIVVDSVGEIDRIDSLCSAMNTRARVMVRVTTGVHAGGHEFIATAHEDQKFGLSLATGAAREAVQRITACEHLDFVGLHSHIGSQIFDKGAFVEAATRLMGLRKELMDAGINTPELDLGGGYAISYWAGDSVAPSPKEYADELARVISTLSQDMDMEPPHISIEPGRSIAGPSTVTLYEVGTVKDVVLEDGSVRRYISVDGGMADNIRPALYGSVYTAALANRRSDQALTRCRIVGSHCESGDIIINDIALPCDVGRGDLLAVPATGAYGKSMASNYNMLPTPPVVGISGDKTELLVRPRTINDLISEDVS
ncbi:MAG: diaminopimelate decarboxylase [Actinomycetaceae bacterium]|nr:diaminopimelate decarboxylase [Actinomycetaceae bacterium]